MKNKKNSFEAVASEELGTITNGIILWGMQWRF